MEDSDLPRQLRRADGSDFTRLNEYVLWQGEPHKLHVFVIQQGTVSLWDEVDGRAVLRDVRGAGDMLGIERFIGAPCCLHSARSASDVVIYSFPAADFEELVLKYPYARQFVEVHETVIADHNWTKDARDPQEMFLHDVAGRKTLESCSERTSILGLAQSMLSTGSDAMAVVDGGQSRPGGGDSRFRSRLQPLAPGMPHSRSPVCCRTFRRRSAGRVGHRRRAGNRRGPRRRVGPDVGRLPERPASSARDVEDIARVFGDQPISILREIRVAANLQNCASSITALAHWPRALTSAASLDWLARFVSDRREHREADCRARGLRCRLRAGASAGRPAGESLTRACAAVGAHSPTTRGVGVRAVSEYERVSDALVECDYLARTDISF